MLLIVDRDPSFLEVAQQQLADCSRAVLFAGSAKHAIQLLGVVGKDVAAALVDVRMQGPKSGIALIKELRVDYPQMPLIAITAHGDSKEVERARAAGAAAVLEKPITEEWRSAIARVRLKH